MKRHHVPTGGHATKDITSVKQVHPVQTEHVVPAKKAHFKNSMGQMPRRVNFVPKERNFPTNIQAALSVRMASIRIMLIRIGK
jgi:hypothetical protein